MKGIMDAIHNKDNVHNILPPTHYCSPSLLQKQFQVQYYKSEGNPYKYPIIVISFFRMQW